MPSDNRLNQIVSLVDRRGFVTVRELSELYEVSEVTIRRDLQRLDGEGRLQRTYGGAASIRSGGSETAEAPVPPPRTNGAFLDDSIDVIVATAVDPRLDRLLLDKASTLGVPIVAESVGAEGMVTVVAVDNYAAARDLGRWTGEHAAENHGGQARVLDLTYHLANTTARSQGFRAGLQEVLPEAVIQLSINAQARGEIAYQLTRDALKVHPNINIIFAINDATALGALRACQDLGVDPSELTLVTFGLEGDTMKDALLEDALCKAGLAMFPEIVGPACVDAAIRAYAGEALPEQLLTPHAVLTPETLLDFYHQDEEGWRIDPLAVAAKRAEAPNLGLFLASEVSYPRRIGFVLSYSEHEWYQSLCQAMEDYTSALGIELEVIDAAENMRDELTLRKRGIARLAATLVGPGDVVIIDGGQVTAFLAEELAESRDITVITNSLPVFDALRANPDLTLIATGGMFRLASQTLIGPTTESVLRELRADKLFLAISGVSFDFGLSHTNLAEVTVKQAMIRAAREVILLADHTKFDEESVVQVAPISAVDKLITDNALPASARLDLTKLGVEILLASS